jgi:hypothetical protein
MGTWKQEASIHDRYLSRGKRSCPAATRWDGYLRPFPACLGTSFLVQLSQLEKSDRIHLRDRA